MTTFVLMAGLPGTGKSTLAEALARELGGVVLSKDTVRAALFPGTLTDYTREQDDLCFNMVLDAARYLARQGRTDFVFLDGRTFSRSAHVDQAIRAAAEAASNWRIIRTTCPDELAEARLAADVANHPAGNRNGQLYREIKARVEPMTLGYLEVDTAQPVKDSVARAIEYLVSGR